MTISCLTLIIRSELFVFIPALHNELEYELRDLNSFLPSFQIWLCYQLHQVRTCLLYFLTALAICGCRSHPAYQDKPAFSSLSHPHKKIAKV